MGDEGQKVETPVPWFVQRWRAFAHAMLYDEAAVWRWLGTGLMSFGGIVISGGSIPGYDVVLPLVGMLSPKLGAPMIAVGGWILGGRTRPTMLTPEQLEHIKALVAKTDRR